MHDAVTRAQNPFGYVKALEFAQLHLHFASTAKYPLHMNTFVYNKTHNKQQRPNVPTSCSDIPSMYFGSADSYQIPL